MNSDRKQAKFNRSIKMIFSIVIGCSLMLLSSCMYLNLMEFKKQMRNFEDNFAFKNQNGVYFLKAKNPILTKQDVKVLARTSPSKEQSVQGDDVWEFFYDKVNKDDIKFDLTLRLIFRSNKLEDLFYPKQLSGIFKEHLIKQGFKSIGESTYNTDANELINSGKQYTLEYSDIPTKKMILSNLGQPTSVFHEKNIEVLLYKYKVATGEESVYPWIKVGIRKKDAKVSFISGNIFGPGLYFQLLK